MKTSRAKRNEMRMNAANDTAASSKFSSKNNNRESDKLKDSFRPFSLLDPNDFTDNDGIRKLEELEDGSKVYEVGPNLDTVTESGEEQHNLAINFPEDGLKRLSTHLLKFLEKDAEERTKSRAIINKVRPYLGLTLDQTVTTFLSANQNYSSQTIDSTILTALIRIVCIILPEILPANSPTDFKITGQQMPELEDKGENLKDLFNYFLTEKDRAYYDDFRKCIMYNTFEGSAYKKVYYDELEGEPRSRFILPEDILIDPDCTSILDATRITHILRLTKREILLKQNSGIYREVELPYLNTLSTADEEDGIKRINNKIDTPNSEDQISSLYTQYECHTYIDLNEFKGASIFSTDKEGKDIPLPYIITIDKTTKEVLSIYKNYNEETLDKKEEYFVKYTYLTGFDINGLGLAHLGGSSAISLTTILNQLIDAASFQNFPGGIRSSVAKNQNTELTVRPGQWVSYDPGNLPLKDVFMSLPYNGPSPALRELRLEVINQSKELFSTTELGMMSSKENIPVGTTLAMLEQHNKIQSAVLRSIHDAFSYELRLLYKCFRKTIGTVAFNTDNGPKEITAEDFVDDIIIVPANDPAINSSIQKIVRANSIMQNAMQAPDLHNMLEVYKINYKSQGIDDNTIEKILKPDPSAVEIPALDPISENANAMQGKPLNAAMWQDHNAHQLVHSVFARDNQDKPEIVAAIMAHNTQHAMFQYLIDSQELLGFELPSPEELQNPEIQNTIALGMAQKLEESGSTQSQDEQMATDPNIIADIEQRKEDNIVKEKTAALKAETDTLRAQLSFETEKMKIESEEKMAQLRAEVELMIIDSNEQIAALKNQLDLLKSNKGATL